MYKLFLDDERFPPDNGGNWVICRTVDEAKQKILECIPDHIAFDHDLGPQQQTGYDLAKWLVEQDYNHNIDLNENFTFSVHSMNPIGAENIKAMMSWYLRYKRGNLL